MIRIEMAIVGALILAPSAHAVQEQDPSTGSQEEPAAQRTLVVEPSELTLKVGDRAELKATVQDASGAVLDEEVFFFSRRRRSVSIDDEGLIEALAPGEFTVVARTRRSDKEEDSEAGEGQEGRAMVGERLTVEISVTILSLPLERIELVPPAGGLYSGTDVEIGVRPVDTRGGHWAGGVVELDTDAPEVASFASHGILRVHSPGRFTISAKTGDVHAEKTLVAVMNPIASLSLTSDASLARTGDVVHFEVTARDSNGNAIDGVPIQFSLFAQPVDDLGEPASAQIVGDGRFVAELPGDYTIIATSGTTFTRSTVHVEPRKAGGRFELVGRGKVHDVHTSDLWVWEGVDGRDYAVTGTWGADGDAIFWDVTDPGNIERISKITVDARTVNDVKVSQDGRVCVLSREGASDRKNGIVLVDVSNPREPAVISTFDENLTGGVHNVFVDGDKVYALSAGRRYDVIDISDSSKPHAVGTFELETPRHSIHDVWVADGLAYSSNWSNGVQIVDVGNGIRGGSPNNPVKVASYAYPSGWNHAAFPYKNEESGRFYVVAGDEAFPYGLNVKDTPTYARGWLHFIDFTNFDEPEEVARYQVPEAGSHNLWIEGNVCYAAFYNGGVRAVDVTGELMGDLYRQGREIAWFSPTDAEGYIPNSPMVWGPQPYKGNVFFSDWNTGLWCVRLIREGYE